MRLYHTMIWSIGKDRATHTPGKHPILAVRESRGTCHCEERSAVTISNLGQERLLRATPSQWHHRASRFPRPHVNGYPTGLFFGSHMAPLRLEPDRSELHYCTSSNSTLRPILSGIPAETIDCALPCGTMLTRWEGTPYFVVNSRATASALLRERFIL